VVIESARRTSASRFPYSLWYVVDEGGVTILAVAHHRRKPDYWLDRLPS
jgi:plasmid stabilization system protein ParE